MVDAGDRKGDLRAVGGPDGTAAVAAGLEGAGGGGLAVEGGEPDLGASEEGDAIAVPGDVRNADDRAALVTAALLLFVPGDAFRDKGPAAHDERLQPSSASRFRLPKDGKMKIAALSRQSGQAGIDRNPPK